MDQIEFEDPEHSVCECCGKTTTRLTRFVTRDGEAFAVYYAAFTQGHPGRGADVMVGLGDWSEDADPETARVAFTYRIWGADEAYELGFIEPEDSPWDTTFLGRRLGAAEARSHPRVQEVYDLSDHTTRCDEPLIAFLGGPT
jgi:hypothetical protein